MNLVTGGSGFLGLHLVRKLIQLGETVRIFDIAEINDEEIENSVEYARGDVRDYDAVYEACKGVNVVYHNAAALPIARAGRTYWDVNVGGTRNVLESCLKHGIDKVVFVSTSAVYGIPKYNPITESTPLTPLGDYGWSKYEAEEVCKNYRENRLGVAIIRPRTMVGTGRLGIFQILFEWIRKGKRIYILGSGDNLFQLLSASDLVDACILSVQKGIMEDFNIGAEEFSTVRNDLEALATHAGTDSKVTSINAAFAKNILRFLDALRLSPLVNWHYETPDKPFYFDITKAKTMLGWQPKDSNVKMLTDTYDWYLQNYQEASAQVGVTHRKSVKQGVLNWLKRVS